MGDDMSAPDRQAPMLKRRNLRLAWLLGGLALFFLLTSFPFWSGLSRLLGNQAGQ